MASKLKIINQINLKEKIVGEKNIARLSSGKEVSFDACGDQKDSFNGKQWKCIGHGLPIRINGKVQACVPLRKRKYFFKQVGL